MLLQDYGLSAAGDPPHPPGLRPGAPGDSPQAREDLAFVIEVWDATHSAPEQVVAVTSTSSLGYAVFYAAAREYLGRDVTLKHKGAVLSRWRVPGH